MMKKFAIGLGCALALAGCQPSIGDDDLDNLKNDIRQAAEQQGLTVKQINLRAEGNDRVVGDATVAPRANPTAEIRWDCSAQRENGTRLQWRCAPPGQAAASTAGTPAPAAAPTPPPVAAPAPPPTGTGRAAFVGRWTDNGDCSVVTLLGEDGIFIAPNGARGNWEVQGTQLTLSGPGGSVSWQVFLNDPNTMTLTDSAGGQAQSTRC